MSTAQTDVEKVVSLAQSVMSETLSYRADSDKRHDVDYRSQLKKLNTPISAYQWKAKLPMVSRDSRFADLESQSATSSQGQLGLACLTGQMNISPSSVNSERTSTASDKYCMIG